MGAGRTRHPACLLDQATEAGQHTRVIALTAAMEALLRHDGPWTTAVTRHAAAAQAADRIGDRLAQANAHNDLGNARVLTGDHQGAAQALEQALAISRDIGDRPGQAYALELLGRGADVDWRLPGFGAGAGTGAGHLPRHRRPARPGLCP